jgi:hypothetical protein
LVLSDPSGPPVDAAHSWNCGFLPPLYQGTVVRPQEPRILNLDPPPDAAGDVQPQNLNLLAELNKRHLANRPAEADLEARIASYELAAAMQTAAKEALDISREPERVRTMYGLDRPETREYGTRCLIARRLVERGVLFVQIFLGGQPWENHNTMRDGLPAICKRTDQPAAALVKDLKQRGLLDTTLVHWVAKLGDCRCAKESGRAPRHTPFVISWTSLSGRCVKIVTPENDYDPPRLVICTLGQFVAYRRPFQISESTFPEAYPPRIAQKENSGHYAVRRPCTL